MKASALHHRPALNDFAIDIAEQVTSPGGTVRSLIRGRAIVVAETTPLTLVHELLLERRVSALVVANANASVRGLVTRTDVMGAARGATAGDVMSGLVFALPGNARIERAAALMGYEGVAQIVVVGRGGILLGLVSAIDVARHLAISAGFLHA